MDNVYNEKSTITQEEFIKLIEEKNGNKIDFVLIDVREIEEYNSTKIYGVDYHMPLSNISSYIDTIKAISKQIIIYCRTDRRSKMAYEYLKENGVKSCYLLGGITDYKGKIL